MKRKRPSPAQKKAAREVLLLSTTSRISSERSGQLSRILAEGIDWEHLLNLAEFHGVVPLVAHNLVDNGFQSQIPQSYLERLKRVYNSTIYKNVIFSIELANVLAAFNERNIAVVPLKGTVLAEILYGNPALRAIVDMDILVHSEDLPQARSLLAELGYKQMIAEPAWEHQFHDVPYCKEGKFTLFLELHWNLDDRRLVSIPEPEIWRRTQPWQLQGISTTVLSPEDNLLFLTTRLFRPSTEPLKFLSDITELIKKYEGVLDWDYIVASAGSWQSELVVSYALTRAKDLLRAPVPDYVLKILKPNLFRRLLLGLLINREDLVIPLKGNKLRVWTLALAQVLMMKHTHQALAVLSRQQGERKRGAWLSIAFWVMLVLVAAVWRHGKRVVSRQ